MDADQIQPELDKDAPRRAMERLVRQLSDGWNHLSASLVGMPISDPRWKPAVDWLNENRQYQIPIPRLPNDPHEPRGANDQ